ncbi:MAG: hypothetical protein ABIZ05_12620 [Pseudonocardiaceae bacterium]
MPVACLRLEQFSRDADGWAEVVASAAGKVNGKPGEWAGEVIPLEELTALLARFGMIVGLDASPEADKELQATQMAHALVGAAEAHATRAEQAYRDAGAEPPDITQASLMAFAGVNCQSESDELALIQWRATRLAGALGALDFSGPIQRQGELGSGDSLIRTMRLVAAALSGMATAAHASVNPQREPGQGAAAGQALAKAMSALEQAAKDVHRHRAIGELMGMAD